MLLESFLDIDIRDHNGRVLLECTCPTCAFFFFFFLECCSTFYFLCLGFFNPQEF